VSEWADFLREKEEEYGGGQVRVDRRVVSRHDGRLKRAGAAEAIPGKMLSGARFIPESGYAEVHGAHLCPRWEERFVLVEMGVLLGVGLAVWCDVLPRARIIGLDVDPKLFDKGLLKARGAFRVNEPEVHFFDELGRCASLRLERALKGERIDVMIDDALHDDASIMKAMAIFLPFMADQFTYFIEDNKTVHRLIRETYPDLTVASHGRLTVVTDG
jgi:hypothetical protein